MAYHGAHALQFHVSGSNYGNSGWNWRGWQANAPADDATLHANLLVAFKVDGAAKPSGMHIILRSLRPEDHNKSADSDIIDLLAYCPTLLDGARMTWRSRLRTSPPRMRVSTSTTPSS